MNEIIKKLSLYGIIPVIKINDDNKALQLADALSNGGLPVMEITLRTEKAISSLKKISSEMPDITIGAGTVTTIEQVKQSVDSGAKFIVSPGFNEKTVEYCRENNIPHLPGVSSASDIERAVGYGIDVLKFFPAEQAGGIKMIESLSAPYGNIKFIPTGGINENNMLDYLKCGSVIACGGSFMVNENDLIAGNFKNITQATQKAVKKLLGFSLAHLGINCENTQDAKKASELFCTLFGLDYLENNASIFSSALLEIMKIPNYGKYGHIAVGTNFIERAVFYLGQKGVNFIADSKKYNDKNDFTAIYLEDEILGFAVHLVRK